MSWSDRIKARFGRQAVAPERGKRVVESRQPLVLAEPEEFVPRNRAERRRWARQDRVQASRAAARARGRRDHLRRVARSGASGALTMSQKGK